MSIDTILRDLEGSGKLFKIQPRFAIDDCRRSVYVTDRLNAALRQRAEKREGQMRIASLRVDIETFITSERIDHKYIVPLNRGKPVGLWEVRSTSPQPQFRVLGGFVERNTLVLFSEHLRKDLSKKGRGDEAVDAAARDFIRGWRALFGNDALPMIGAAIDLIDGYIEQEIPP